MRRTDVGRAIGGRIEAAQIVADEHDKVGLFGRGAGCRKRQQSETSREQCQTWSHDGFPQTYRVAKPVIVVEGRSFRPKSRRIKTCGELSWWGFLGHRPLESTLRYDLRALPILFRHREL